MLKIIYKTMYYKQTPPKKQKNYADFINNEYTYCNINYTDSIMEEFDYLHMHILLLKRTTFAILQTPSHTTLMPY